AQMYIVNPLTAASVAKLFSTHPPIQERIRRLRSMA
ncbi:MAG: M48 family metalloprotease, partial [Deltaproteobacteria bacterium]|nr:M48 family metalloprotease [Deltaproteobacteria bacterium]